MDNNINLPSQKQEATPNPGNAGGAPQTEEPQLRGNQMGLGKRATVHEKSPINSTKAQEIFSQPPTIVGKVWGALGYMTSFVTSSWTGPTTKTDEVAMQGPLSQEEVEVSENDPILQDKARDLGISEPKIAKAIDTNTLGKVVRLREKTLKQYDTIIQNYEKQAEGRLFLKTGEQTQLTAELLQKVIKSALKHDISGEGTIVKKGGQIFLTQKLKGKGLQITEQSGLRRLGAGAFGVVYKELNVTTGQPVALKIALGDDVSQERAVKALHQEGKNLQIVNGGRHHTLGVQPPGFALYPVTAKGQKGPGFIVPLFSKTLDKLIQSPDLSLEQRLTFTKQLFSGLASVHAAKMVHRDIKPDNIGVAVEEAYLADFGIAESTEGLLGKGLSGLLNWTMTAIDSLTDPGVHGDMEHPWYPRNDSSPYRDALLYRNEEQAREVLEKSDVFALGRTAYCLLSGQGTMFHRFEGKALIARGVPPEVISILIRTQDDDPLKRPSAVEVFSAFEMLGLHEAA